jgi:hypothetical protein
MNEIKEGTTEALLREGNTMLKALISKVVDLGTAVKDNSELIRQMPDRKETLERGEKQLDELTECVQLLFTGTSQMSKSCDQHLNAMDVRLSEVKMLREELKQHTQLFEKPLEKTIHHRHFLAKPLYTLVVMLLVLMVGAFFWIKTGATSDQYRANDSKWRHLKLIRDSTLLNTTEHIDRDWLADPAAFEQLVNEEEERRNEEMEKWAQEQTRHQEVDELHKAEKIK